MKLSVILRKRIRKVSHTKLVNENATKSLECFHQTNALQHICKSRLIYFISVVVHDDSPIAQVAQAYPFMDKVKKQMDENVCHI